MSDFIKEYKKIALLVGIFVVTIIVLFKLMIPTERQVQYADSPGGVENGNGIRDDSISPNGQYMIFEKENSDGTIQILDLLNNKSIYSEFEVIGQDLSFHWNPTSNCVAISYAGRTWITTILYFVEDKKIVELPMPVKIVEELGLKYSLAEESYPYIYPIEWSEDGKNLLCAYMWQDVSEMRQSGWFIWDVEGNQLQLYLENEPIQAEGPDAHLQLKKPDGFSW